MSAYENKKGEVEWLPQAAKQFSTTARPWHSPHHRPEVAQAGPYGATIWIRVLIMIAARQACTADADKGPKAPRPTLLSPEDKAAVVALKSQPRADLLRVRTY
jgi:hypothetical protein